MPAPGTPNTDLFVERTRFNGMLLGAISYGIFFALTIQATLVLVRDRRHKATTRKQYLLLAYLSITFILATIGFAGNARYTQTIWIDQRDVPGGPPILILTELDFWINRLALSCTHLLAQLYRCVVIWNRNLFVAAGMASLFLGSIAMSILVLVQSRIKDFYDINVQIAYLSLTVGTNILFTLLVVFRLLVAHRDVSTGLGPEHTAPYISVITMIIESAAMYSVLGVLYIASFATHSNLSNLIFLDISHVQGIAQLLIIIRVAEGRAIDGTIPKEVHVTSMQFRGTIASQGEDETDGERTAGMVNSFHPKKENSSFFDEHFSVNFKGDGIAAMHAPVTELAFITIKPGSSEDDIARYLDILTGQDTSTVVAATWGRTNVASTWVMVVGWQSKQAHEEVVNNPTPEFKNLIGNLRNLVDVKVMHAELVHV
ncbi:hypothetical protein H0H93_003157 [Arthromyces matolae]|nr:hypothetical protein H0H93_003157 [Arthromyces matolae]